MNLDEMITTRIRSTKYERYANMHAGQVIRGIVTRLTDTTRRLHRE